MPYFRNNFYENHGFQRSTAKNIWQWFFTLMSLAGAVLLTGYVLTFPKIKTHSAIRVKKIAGLTPQQKYEKSLKADYEMDKGWVLGDKVSVEDQPIIQGAAGLVVEVGSGRVLFEKDSGTRRQLASITKVMTAVVALEHGDLDQEIKISDSAANIGENAMGISSGEVYTLNELMYGLLLNSGNDAAYAIAEGLAENSDTFVEWMNIKSRELELRDTMFFDPSGLDDRSYTTPKDLVKLAKYAMKNPHFREYVKTTSKELPESSNHKFITLQNQTNLVGTYPGVAGIKTGYTEEAGLCLLTYAYLDGKEVIGVVLKSTDRRGDMILMLDHSFSSLGIKVAHNL
jgi:D-alanyl-D-alanine carboxypeptidase